MNAVRKPEQSLARQELHDQLAVAHERLDAARKVSLEEFGHWLNRVRELNFELYGSNIKSVTVTWDRDHYGSREEQRREDDYA